MKASRENPIYSVYVVSGSTKYNLTNAVEYIDMDDREKQISQIVTIQLANIKYKGKQLSSLINVRDRVYVYANDGEQNAEVFRGYVWTRSYKAENEGNLLQLRCYDNLIYFQESEESKFFASGKSTKDVVSSICSDWGVKLEYSYSSITHSKLALRGNLTDIIKSDVLDLVKERTGKKYVIRSEKDVVHIKNVGANTKVYQIKAGKNAMDIQVECTMDGMTTKVIILGKADDDDRQPIEATISGNTSTYGTIQKIINRSENTSLADAKKEAQSIIDEDGKPKWEYTINLPDIPWIRKGDKIQCSAGGVSESLIVIGISRSISNKEKKMSLTLEKV